MDYLILSFLLTKMSRTWQEKYDGSKDSLHYCCVWWVKSDLIGLEGRQDWSHLTSRRFNMLDSLGPMSLVVPQEQTSCSLLNGTCSQSGSEVTEKTPFFIYLFFSVKNGPQMIITMYHVYLLWTHVWSWEILQDFPSECTPNCRTKPVRSMSFIVAFLKINWQF